MCKSAKKITLFNKKVVHLRIFLQEKYDASNESRDLKLHTISNLERYFYLGKYICNMYVRVHNIDRPSQVRISVWGLPAQ